MGSWSYGCGGGDESSVSMREGIVRSRNLWDFDGNNQQGFVELDSQDLVRKALGNSSSSHAQSSSPAKRMRPAAAAAAAGGVNSQSPPYCQVHGCRKDLSLSKDYHKRHRVCEVHSKTAKVTVNGIEQRFCQQCSRFHLLAEFDDGKGSCRKRLAGHNERRRKPHSGMISGRGGRLFQTFAGTRFQGAAFSTSSVVHQDVLPGNVMHPQRYGTNGWHRNVKIEDGTDSSPQLPIPMPNGHIPPSKSLYDGGISDITKCRISDSNSNSNAYMGGPGQGPVYYYINTSLQGGMNGFDLSSSSNLHQSTSHSGRAPSLLSPISAENRHHYDIARVSEKLTSAMSNAVNDDQLGMNSCEDNNNSAPLQQMVLFSDSGPSYCVDHVVPGSDFRGRDGPTADLLQLSSQLQRADHEDDERHRKQESGPFSSLRNTSTVERAIDDWA